MKYLVVNADDFGLTTSINEGIAKAYKEGIVTSINFLPTGGAYDDALRLAADLKLKEIGAHLSLTETRPITDPGKIPSLAAKDNNFYKSHNTFLMKFLLRRINMEEVYIELKNQLDELWKAGLRVTNLSSHEHIHMIPEILKIFVKLAKEYGIRSIRFPHREKRGQAFDLKEAYRSLILSYFEKGMRSILDAGSIIYADHFIGLLGSGAIEERKLSHILSSLKDGVTELVTHPGFLGPEILDRYRFHLNCEYELSALTSPKVRKLISDKGIRLVTYSESASV